MKHQQLVRFLFPALLALAIGTTAFGQTAQVTGRITDQSGAVVPGAQITLSNLATGINRETVSNDEGYFTIPLVQPGEYRIAVKKEGFKPVIQSGITLSVEQVARIDFTLETGVVTEVVNVEAAAPLLEKESSTLGTVVDNKRITELPLLGRNPYSLVNLLPGVRAPQSLNNLPVDMFTTQFVSINGARATQNEFMLDGATNTNPAWAGPTIFPGADSVQEFKVITNNFAAEYGRAAGGVFNVVTKSGTNDFHGSVYEFLRNDALNANEFFANRAGQKKPPFRFNQFGFTLGGPISLPKGIFGPVGGYDGKNRTFFFTNYEGVRQRQAVTFAGRLPTALEREGDFSQTRNAAGALITIYNPLTTRPNPAQPGTFIRDPFPDNKIPANLIDPVAKAMLQFVPLPNTTVGANNFTTPSSQQIDKDIFTVKIDHQISDRQRISGRYSYDDSPWNRPIIYGNIASPSSGPQIFGRKGFILDDTYTFSPSLLGSFKYSFNRLTNTRLPLSFGYDLTQLGFPASFAAALQFPSIPVINVAGFTNTSTIPNAGNGLLLGSADYIRFGLDTHTWAGNLTKTAGSHNFKWGGEYRLIRNNQIQRGDLVNNFAFTSAFTQGPNAAVASATAGAAFASFLLGTPNSGQISLIPSIALQNTTWALFIQDDWKITPKLTLNLGIRYDYEAPRTERYNQLANFDFNAAPPLNAPGLNLKGGLTFVGVGGNPRPDRNNFAPRLGFAWSMTEKTVIRGGAGIFYAPYIVGTGTGLTPFGLAGYAATTTFVSSLDGVTPLNFLRNPYPQGLRLPTGNTRGLGTLLGENIAFVDRNIRTPYAAQWNLNVQRELPGKFLVEAAYVGSRGVKLNTDRELNQLPDSALAQGNALRELVTNPFAGQITSGALSAPRISRAQLLRPFPHFLSVVETNATWGSSSYHSLQVKGERRFANGFTLLASYSFSKLIDDVTGWFAGEAISGTVFQNFNNLRAERSISALDVPQRLVASFIWELPFGPGKKHLTTGFASKVLGGWQADGILTVSDGNILGITAQNNQTFSQGGNQRPNWTGVNPTLSNPTLDKWFDTSAFSQPAQYAFGNAPRTIPGLRSHGVGNLDFSLIKNTKIGERINTQFRTELFNALNTPRFGLPNTTFGNTNFGVVSNTINSARVIQLALKVMF